MSDADFSIYRDGEHIGTTPTLPQAKSFAKRNAKAQRCVFLIVDPSDRKLKALFADRERVIWSEA